MPKIVKHLANTWYPTGRILAKLCMASIPATVCLASKGAPMTELPSKENFSAIRHSFDADPSMSLHADAYTEMGWFNVDLTAITAKSWQWVCHAEKLRVPGSFTTAQIAGQPIAIVRDGDGTLRAFSNVCKHRAPEPENLTFGHRLTYEVKSNWKNVVDNFLECYHCPTAHKDFCDLVDMDTYMVTTHGIRSIDEVLQVEDIGLVESVQCGMETSAFTQGRIVNDPDGSGKSEHALHHFHGLVLDAYAKAAPQ